MNNWSRRQVYEAAGLTSGIARAAVRRGYLPNGPLLESDIAILKVIAAVSAFPGPANLPLPRVTALVEERNRNAIRFARGLVADTRTPAQACVLVTPTRAIVVEDESEVGQVLMRLTPDPVLVLPVGAWRLTLPGAHHTAPTALVTQQTREATARQETDPVPLAETAAEVLAFRRPPTGHPDGEPW